jgi:hypothetical protein
MTRTTIGLLTLALAAPATAMAQDPAPPGNSGLPGYTETLPIGGTVNPTLSLRMGSAPTFSAFIPGAAADYTASTTASVTSTAGDGLLTVADPSTTATGHLVNGSFSLPQAVQIKASSPGGTGSGYAAVGGSASPTPLLRYTGPVSNDPIALGFEQSIGAGDALRSGRYSKTLTYTLSTTMP